MNHLTKEQQQQLKEQLLAEQRSLRDRLKQNDHYGLTSSFRESGGDLSSNDNHPGDLGTEMFERGKDIALNESAEKHADDVNVALHFMETGQYGTCIACGKPIPFERLEAIPTTLYCIEHVPNPHANHRRPREEELMAPPFGRTSLDELPEQNEFDGEDAWQIVESWGNSNSPAMAEDPHVADYEDMYIEADEPVGYVEPIESFLATDLYGKHVTVVRNGAYHAYMAQNEGEPLLEPEPLEDPLD